MKKNVLLLLSCMLGCACFAAPRYWVGPVNGNWNNSNNWSETSQGPGGAGVPGATDSVIIYNGSEINMDASPTVSDMVFLRSTLGYNNPSQIVLYTATGSVLTILKSFALTDYLGLKDSCSENVPFNIVFNGATGATGYIGGTWTLMGRVPISAGNGATLTAEPGSLVTVKGFGGIASGRNSAYINSTSSSLDFSTESFFSIIDNLDAAIPDATFEQDRVVYCCGFPPVESMRIPGSSVSIIGNLGKLTCRNTSFRNFAVGLGSLSADASLALPNGTRITSLAIGNTNGHTLTLLSETGDSSGVSLITGTLTIEGDNNSKVAMAKGTSAASATNYRIVTRFFNQSGSNFSLQDFNGARGTSTLFVARDITQTGGTFITNSTATDTAAHFVLELNGPEFYSVNRNLPSVSTGQFITMRSGTIDNGRNKVTLRINNQLIGYSTIGQAINLGVTLTYPLTVGRLELLSGTLNTTDTSMVTVTDPGAATAIKTDTAGLSFVTGPMRRATNASSPYLFPTGKGVIILQFNDSRIYYHSCSVIPVSTAPSMYQAEYFLQKFTDSTVTAPLKGVFNKEYWNIAKVAGADAQVRLALKAAVPGATTGDGIVVARYTGNSWVSERGTTVTPGYADNGSVVSRPLAAFGLFTFGFEPVVEDTVVTYNCPKDTLIITGAANCKAKVSWRAPNALFPQTIGVPGGSNATTAQLNFKGTFNGHGYYQSGDQYRWPDASSAAAGVGGHLVTITSPDENNFVFTNLNQRNNYAWIGLYNTGTVGSFAWVTGEPLNYTNWIPGQPDNLWNDPAVVHEPYVHINGWADPSACRWNDNGDNIQANFIAEFDKAVLTYRQIAGPANGDSLNAGTYTVCYEMANAASGKRDTCCFNITVQCNAITAAATGTGTNDGRQHTFSAIAFANPSSTGFSVKVSSDKVEEKIRMQVADVSGRVVENKTGIIAGSTVRFGSGYVQGLYFARISQGAKMVIIKLVKE